MDQEKWEEIKAMLDAGMSVPAAASEMGVSAQTIRNHMKANGIAQGERGPSATTLPNDVLVAEAYEEGLEIPKILNQFGISRAKLYQVLAKYSVPTRQVQNKDTRKRAMDEAVSMYQQGVVIRQITAETGIHQPTLHAELAKRGVPLRRPRVHR